MVKTLEQLIEKEDEKLISKLWHEKTCPVCDVIELTPQEEDEQCCCLISMIREESRKSLRRIAQATIEAVRVEKDTGYFGRFNEALILDEELSRKWLGK